MSSAVGVALGVLTSNLQAAGLFGGVQTSEPKNPPGLEAITAAIFLSSIKPALARASGLDRGTGLYEFTLRLYSNAFQEPVDQIDPNLVIVVDKVMDALCGDFTLGGNVREIDIIGAHSGGLSAKAGHVTVSSSVYRAIDITVPLIVNDVVVYTP